MRNSLLGAAPKLWASTLDEQKLERLDRFLVEGDYAELWLLRPRNIAWVTSGADAVVDRASDTGAVALGYDGKAMHAVAADNEADRMREEELPTDVSVTKFPW